MIIHLRSEKVNSKPSAPSQSDVYYSTCQPSRGNIHHYRLADELASGYDDEDSYRSTLLESVLDTSLADGDIIEGKDFCRLSLSLEIPASIKFCECDFRQIRVYLIEACENFEELKKTLPPEELNHFKRCDFTGADFFVSDSYMDILTELGAEFYD